MTLLHMDKDIKMATEWKMEEISSSLKTSTVQNRLNMSTKLVLLIIIIGTSNANKKTSSISRITN